MLNTVSDVAAARACNAVSRAMFSAPERGGARRSRQRP
jgi:hypothetical protein